MSLSGLTAVVTGAAGTLCSSMASALLEENAEVCLAGRTADKLNALADSFKKAGFSKVRTAAVDVTRKDDLEKLSKDLMSSWGRIDILINGAGGNDAKACTGSEIFNKNLDTGKSFFDLNPDDLKSVMDLNWLGTLLPSQVFAQLMIEKGGLILNISSMSALRPLTKIPAYSSAKAAVDNLTKWMAVHFAAQQIRVNAIAPGFFISDQNRFLLYEADGKTLSARGEKIIRATPMGRFGNAGDLKSAVKFLCSPASSFITGIVLPVDGGFSAYSGV